MRSPCPNNAQPLRFLDLLLGDTISVPFRSFSVQLPHPANFAIHKRLISGRRYRDKAAAVMRALHRAEQDARVSFVFGLFLMARQTRARPFGTR